jgi:NhaP-type Na+/H+ or K+/H+ antiporter
MSINSVLLLISLIVVFGYIAEWVFRKFMIPDILFLILLGFILGSSGLQLINTESLSRIAPLFTTFTLLFLMFEGALSIDLKSFASGIGTGISIGMFNFFLSSLLVAGVFLVLLQDIPAALMLGFSLGGITSAFIIPVLKQLGVNKKLYSIATLESAITDVLAIVLALTMMEIQILHVLDIKNVLSQITSLFAVAGIVGVFGGAFWIFLEHNSRFIEKDKNYLLTIAYLIILYFVTEYLGGNGAIASLFFGMCLANSRTLLFIGRRIIRGKRKSEPEEANDQNDRIISRKEMDFYGEISFFLKTFFFVYIGMLLNIQNLKVIGLGTLIAVALMAGRSLTPLVARGFNKEDRGLLATLFPRGIAPVAILIIAIERNVVNDQLIVDTVYFVITATIILSSIRIFLYRLKQKKEAAS